MDDAISLDALCGKHEVSRTPVVQAVKLLVNDGVLEKLSNGRVVVPTFDQDQIKNICDVRLMIVRGYRGSSWWPITSCAAQQGFPFHGGRPL